MNIKSLLLGSAAALAAVTGAQAADAIVAAEPEALEYVRVCDAFGTGYFYIPGTETCLKIGGRVRTQIEYQDVSNNNWGTYSQGYLTFEAKSDTEFGALTGYINIETGSGHTYTPSAGSYVKLDGAWINVAGFDVGYFYNWWDEHGIAGETDSTGGNLFNAARYLYDAGTFQLGASVEDLNNSSFGHNDDVGITGLIKGDVAGFSALLIGSYDFDRDESAFKAVVTAAVGPGSLEFAGIYSTDRNEYWDVSEWSVAAAYSLKATEKLTITPGVQYFGEGFVDGLDSWKVGLTAGYQITEGLRTLATVNYADGDGKDEAWNGFLRLQRDF